MLRCHCRGEDKMTSPLLVVRPIKYFKTEKTDTKNQSEKPSESTFSIMKFRFDMQRFETEGSTECIRFSNFLIFGFCLSFGSSRSRNTSACGRWWRSRTVSSTSAPRRGGRRWMWTVMASWGRMMRWATRMRTASTSTVGAVASEDQRRKEENRITENERIWDCRESKRKMRREAA